MLVLELETLVGIEPTLTGLQPGAWPSGSSVFCKRPRQESNLIYDLRTVACCPAHSKDGKIEQVPRQGVEPRLTVSKTVVLSITLARHVD